MDYKNLANLPSSIESLPDNDEPIREIIGRPPSWFVRWGNMMIAFFLMSLFVISVIISYPEIVPGTAVLSGSNIPKEVIVNQPGKIVRLFFNSNDSVKQGQVLAWIESSAEPNKVLELSTKIDTSIDYLNTNQESRIKELLLKNYNQLGELQGPYQVFISAWQQFNDYYINGYYEKKKQMFYAEISTYKSIQSQILNQKSNLEKDDELAKETFKMYETLFQEKVISLEEYRQAQSSLLNKSLTVPQKQVDRLTHEALIQSKLDEIAQLNHDIEQQQIIFKQALFKFKNDIEQWKQKYIIKSPSNGIIITPMPIQENQHIQQGTLIAYINSPDTKYYLELKLTQNSFGKVKVGMKVQLRFNAYPYQEMGYVPGIINYISDISTDSVFRGTIVLPKNLTTNLHKQLQYRSGLQAQALVITKDMSILKRLYYSLVKTTSLN